jgi:parallel beta-helix repeat protein
MKGSTIRTAVTASVLLITVGCGTSMIRVSTPEELLDAIGSDRTILILPGEIRISDALVEDISKDSIDEGWSCESESYSEVNSLLISGVDNLRIVGSGRLESSIVTEPLYGSVINLEDCSGVSIENLSIGHRPRGTCSCGVIETRDCTDITVTDCDLYGCGIEGLYITNTEGFTLRNSVIRDCVEGILMAYDSWDLLFEGCEFSRNGDYFGFSLENCSSVTFRDCIVERNSVEEGYALFEFFNSHDILFDGGIIRDNRCYELFYGLSSFRLIGTEIDNW